MEDGSLASLVAVVVTSDDGFQEPAEIIAIEDDAERAAEDADTTAPTEDSAEDAGPDSDNETGCCPICLEPWTAGGRHRLCSLRCGHLFGRQCIDRWLASGRVKCPQCNAPARRPDIRVLYCRKLVALDTVERDRLEAALAVEQAEKRQLEDALARANIASQVMRAEMEALRGEIARFKKRRLALDDPLLAHVAPVTAPLQFARRVVLGHGGTFQCRTVAFDAHYGILLVTRADAASHQFGIVKVSLWDASGAEFVALHDDAIRAVAASPHGDGLFLTVAADGLLRLSTMTSNSVVQSWRLSAPSGGWSCCFHPHNRNHVFVGMTGGQIARYDLSLPPSAPPEIFTIRGLKRPALPIHSLHVLCASPTSQPLLVGGTMDGPFVHCCATRRDWIGDFGYQGVTCSSVAVDCASSSSSSSFLVSFRAIPPSMQPSRHVLCRLTMDRSKPPEEDGQDGYISLIDASISENSNRIDCTEEPGTVDNPITLSSAAPAPSTANSEPLPTDDSLVRLPFVEFRSQGGHRTPFKTALFGVTPDVFQCWIAEEASAAAHCYQLDAETPRAANDPLPPLEVLATNAGIPILECCVGRVRAPLKSPDDGPPHLTTIVALLTEKHLYLYTS